MKFAFFPKKLRISIRRKKHKILLEKLEPILYDFFNANESTFYPVQLLPLCSARVSFICICCNTAWKPCHHTSYSRCLMLEQVQHTWRCTTSSDIIFFCPFSSGKDSVHSSCSLFYWLEMAGYAINSFSQCIFPRSRTRGDLCKQSAIILANNSS